MIKLVICDLDGTLIGADEILSGKALDLVVRLRTRGILFSLATGRSDYLVSKYARQLNLTIPYITCNGAAIVSGGKRLTETLIPAAPLEDVIRRADHLGFSIVYSINGMEQVWRETSWITECRQRYDRYHGVHRFTPEEWKTIMLDKVLILHDDPEKNIDIIEAYCQTLGPEYTFTRYMDRSVEIVHGSVSKASAMLRLADMLGISPKEILAIGDHQNDIDMIRSAGQGAAVGNATRELKASAAYVCKAENLDGVIEAVDHFCFSLQGEHLRI